MRWRILGVLFFARISMALQFQAVAALSPVMMRDFGVGLAEIGVLIGLYLAPGIIIAYPGGAIGRRVGDSRAVAGGMLLMIAGGALTALGSSWESQVAGRLIAGTGGVLLNVLMSKMVQDWFTGREIATAMAIFVNSWPLGIAAALVVLPAIAEAGGYAGAAAAVTALVGAGLAAFLAGWRPPAKTAAQPTGHDRLDRPALAGVLLAGAIWGLFNAALGTVFGFGPAMLAERGWSLAEASSATSIVLWVLAATVPLGGILSDRTGRRDAILSVAVLAFAAGMLVTALTDHAVVAVFALLGVAGGLAVGPIMSLPAEVLAPQVRAPGMGIFYTLFYGLAVGFPIAAGAVADSFGAASATFVLGAAALLVCVPLLAAFRTTRH